MTINAPKEPLEVGVNATFTATVNPAIPEDRAKYHWHVPNDKIVSGQGTASIVVERPPSSSLTVTVEIAGTPDDGLCVQSTSETVYWNVTPEAEKIVEISGARLDSKPFAVNSVISSLSQNPEDHLYIFLGHKGPAGGASVATREAEIERQLSGKIGRARISVSLVPGTADITEFWRIPPGAGDPTCEKCGAISCPGISVTGPAGVVQPGEMFNFRGTVRGEITKNVSFHWEVSGGTLTEGQGTLKVSVDPAWTADGGAGIIATLNVLGLPDGCPHAASEASSVTAHGLPKLIDEFGRLANAAFGIRFSRFLAELRNNPNHQGYIILYGSDKEIAARERLIANSTVSRRFEQSRITLVRGGEHETGKIWTKLYRIPPGVEYPTP